MGCASSNYFNEDDNNLPKEDYFTRAIYLSKKLNKEEKYKKEKEEMENEKKGKKNNQ